MKPERAMADLRPLPELRFAEIPATSCHRYVGDRFCYMEAGTGRLPAGAAVAWHRLQAARFIAEAEIPPLAAGLAMPLLMVQSVEDRVAPAATNAKLLAAARASRHACRLRPPARGGVLVARQ